MKNLMACVLFAMAAGCVEAEATDTGPYESEDCTTEFAWSYCLDPVEEAGTYGEHDCDYAENRVIVWTDSDEVRHAWWCVLHAEVCLSACGEQE